MTRYDFYILLLEAWALTGGFVLGRMTAPDRPRHRTNRIFKSHQKKETP